jgi:hypothetical protein
MFNHVKNEGYALPEIDQAEVIVIPGKPVAKSASGTSYNQINQQTSGQYPSGSQTQSNNNDQLAKQEDDELALALKLSMQEQENQPKQRTSTQVKLEDLPAAPVEQNAYPDLAFLDLNSDQPKSHSNYSSRPESVNFESRNTDNFTENSGNSFNPPGYNSLEQTDNSEKLTSITLEPGSYEVDHPEIVKNVISGDFDNIQMLDPGNEFLTEEDEVFVRNYNKSLDILQLRINSCHQRGRLIQQDATAQQLFTTVTQQHEKLLTIMAIIDAQRQHFENFNDKLKDMKDVREAIVDTREQIRIQEEARRQEEEAQRKVAMQMKLEKLRQDKDMWMQQQRIHAMARMQGYNNPHIQQQQGFMQNGYAQQMTDGYQNLSMNQNMNRMNQVPQNQTHVPGAQQMNSKQVPQPQVQQQQGQQQQGQQQQMSQQQMSQQQMSQQPMPQQQMPQQQVPQEQMPQIPQQQEVAATLKSPPSSQNTQFTNNSYQQPPSQFYQQQAPPPPPPQMENQPPTAPTPVPYAPMPTPPYNQQMYPPQPQQFMQFQDPGQQQVQHQQSSQQLPVQQQPVQQQPVQQQPVQQFVSETDDDALIKFD